MLQKVASPLFLYHENPNDFLRFICVFEKSLSERCPSFRSIIFVFIVCIIPVTKEGYFNCPFYCSKLPLRQD